LQLHQLYVHSSDFYHHHKTVQSEKLYEYSSIKVLQGYPKQQKPVANIVYTAQRVSIVQTLS
jgi:hypothetical protein